MTVKDGELESGANAEAVASGTSDMDVSDAALNAAAEGAEPTQDDRAEVDPNQNAEKSNETVTGTEEQDTKGDEPDPLAEGDDNASKSRLGRKVKNLEESNKKLEDMLAKALEKLDSFATRQQEAAVKEPAAQTASGTDEEEMPETIITPEDLERYNRVKQRRAEKSLATYQTQYRELFMKNAADDPDFQDVLKFVQSNPAYNKIITDNPVIDVALNYERASKAVLKGKLVELAKKNATPKVPVANEDASEVPTGIGVTTRATSTQKAAPVLDSFAKDFIAKTGMSEAEVADALAGNGGMRSSKSVTMGSV